MDGTIRHFRSSLPPISSSRRPSGRAIASSASTSVTRSSSAQAPTGGSNGGSTGRTDQQRRTGSARRSALPGRFVCRVFADHLLRRSSVRRQHVAIDGVHPNLAPGIFERPARKHAILPSFGLFRRRLDFIHLDASGTDHMQRPCPRRYNGGMSTHAPVSPAEKHSSVMAPPSGDRVSTSAAFAGVRRIPTPINEPNKSYTPGSPERAELKARLKAMASEKIDIPLIIGGREIRTGRTEKSVMPHEHGHVLADYHLAGPEHIQQAIDAAAAARREWAAGPWEDRAAVLLRAAELLATTWRPTINAATMLGQSKTAFQ